MTTQVFRIEGMHCGSCALLIDDTLEDLPGVRSTRTSMRKARTTVDIDPAVTSPDQVILAIGELGYRAVRDE
ncbi:heavy-metal-associated domain-containing protein [Nocardia halotolerans]|uniref:Heavy-metal-associated domain-containing protein n=1 Tax=Nocardia halotolerans TaxID=1755878 RepID=A0ABV8VMP4_9NOCA